MTRVLLTLVLVASCSDDRYTIVTVESRPSVHGASSLEVTLSNAGGSRKDTFALGGKQFPVTFTVTAPDRTGELGIHVEAFDEMQRLVGFGTSTTTVDAPVASVMLDSADFVVNTEYAGNQFLTDDYEAAGGQIGATASGTWTVGFRDECTMCNIFARRFDRTARPANSQLAAGTNAFRVSARLTTSLWKVPAVAASGETTMVFWNFTDTVGSPAAVGLSCRALDAAGAANPPSGQRDVASESAEVVSAAALSNGNYAVVWQTTTSPRNVRRLIVQPDCTVLGGTSPTTVSVATESARGSHVSANETSILYAWVVGGDVRVRPGQFNGPLGTELTAVTKTPTHVVEHVRVVPLGSGFALFARWKNTMTTLPGKLEMYRLDANGNVLGSPTLITAQSRSEFVSCQSFGAATRADGAILVAWHACDAGAGSCEVYGRVVRPTGVPVGEPFVIPTTTTGDQIRPSVAALPDAFAVTWTDSSAADPDRAGQAVRARLVYPPYDEATSVIGAACGGSAPACGEGLACAMGSDGVSRCFEICTPPTCPNGGTCMPAAGGQSACIF